MTTRIGVLSDTHCPEFMPRLPASLARVFDGVQLILHAGDINAAGTLDELRRIAPVEAVRGDHDRALQQLPLVRELVIEGKRVVLVHGDRGRWIEEPHTLLWTLSLGYFSPHSGLPRALRRRFPDADVIVYGHTHRPRIDTLDGVLVFNPGGVHQWNPTTAKRRLSEHPGWFEWCWLQVARHLRRHHAPSAGLLEVSEAGALAKVVALQS
ncbi:MAG TPA: metallophosphoesterase family protein [Candidatus Dormibacteraeota bacterium]|nr:metallophosphoesterase family protein [Candidatus Dormibacteraeota bacterium]